MKNVLGYIDHAKNNVAFMERKLVHQALGIANLARAGKSTVNADAVLSRLKAATIRSRFYLSNLQTIADEVAIEDGKSHLPPYHLLWWVKFRPPYISH